jgi:hypothetical protein
MHVKRVRCEILQTKGGGMDTNTGLTRGRRCVSGAAIATAVLAAAPSVGHHSYALYDNGQTRSLEGVVERYSWANPHVNFKIRLVPALDSKVESWSIESHSPSILKQYGWSSGSLTPGMRVRILCIAARDGSHMCRLLTARLLDSGQTLGTKLAHSSKLPQS